MYSPEELREIYRRLAEPFPEEAIERTKAAVTRKGYDTTGIKYQYIVNRLNEVLGVGGFRVTREFVLRDKQTRSGYPMVEATCDLTLQLGHWENGEFAPFAEATGNGHTSGSEADAKKGSFTNGFKRVAAFFGCGWQAYAGIIDDDNVPADDHQSYANHTPSTTRPGGQTSRPKGLKGRSTSTTKITGGACPAWPARLSSTLSTSTLNGPSGSRCKHVRVAAASCPSLTRRSVSPHTLRHTCALNILRATGDLRKVSLWLGHANQSTTEIYLQTDPIEKIEILESGVPLRLRPGSFQPSEKLIASLMLRQGTGAAVSG